MISGTPVRGIFAKWKRFYQFCGLFSAKNRFRFYRSPRTPGI